MPAKPIKMPFPVAGINERVDFQNQPPYSTVDALNVFSDGMLTEKERGGSRPCAGKLFASQMGSGGKVRLLNTLRFISSGANVVRLIGSAGGTLYRENSGDWQAVTSNATLASDRQLSSVDYYGKLYIADHDAVVISGSDGASGGAGDAFTSATAGSWSGVSIYNHVFVIERHNAINAQMALVVGGSPSDGDTLVRDPVTGLACLIAFDASVADAQTALERVYGTGNLSVTGSAGNYTIEFIGDMAGMEVEEPEVSIAYLDGGTPTVGITTTVRGADAFQYAGVWLIESVGGTTLTTVKTMRSDLTGIVFRIERGPKVYDPVANTLELWIQDDDEEGLPKGAVPVGREVFAQFNNRIFAAGGIHSPHTFDCCRAGDEGDWDASQEDVGRAIIGPANTDARIGEPIVALIPHENQCMIIACRSSLWVLRGDITSGGIANVDQTIGIVDRFAWASSPEGVLFMLTFDGLYAMDNPCGGKPYSVSREQMPKRLLNVNTSTHTVSMGYCKRYRMLGVWVAENTTSAPATHYLVDCKLSLTGDRVTAGFWKAKLGSANFEPFFVHERRDTSSDYSLVAMGGRDGYVRVFKHDLAQDDSVNISSEVWIGPIALSPDEMHMGRINELRLNIPQNSGDIAVSVYSGDSAELALADPLPHSLLFSSTGHSISHYVRKRGAAAYLKITNGENGTRWEFSEALLTVLPGGKVRP